MSFEVKKGEVDGLTLFHFCGQIDEEAVFPSLGELGAQTVIDLKEVSAINSVGIRSWIMWFGNFTGTHFIFINCPKALVMQMNMVEGFLPEKSEVRSLEVPFFCEDCDQEKNVLFYVGKEILFENGQVKLNFDRSTICKDGCDPELDVSEIKFFRFLTARHGENAA